MRNTMTRVLLGAEEKEQWLAAFRRFADPEAVVFMDIETTGLSRAYDSVYLVGCLSFEDGQFYIEQQMIQDLTEEPALVESYCSRLQKADTIVTFNGDTFDLPFMANRHRYLHCRTPLPKGESVDLFRRYRPLAKVFGLENSRLKTIERFLDIDREDAFSGGELIAVFEEYLRTGDAALEKTLLLHNYEDILNLPRLLKLDTYTDCLRSAPVESIRVREDGPDHILLDVSLAQVPCLSYAGDLAYCRNREETLHFHTEAGTPDIALRLPAVQGLYFHYLPDPENYYYLPETDAIIHASVADTLKGVRKKKATAANCRIAKEGCFVLGRTELPDLHTFRAEKKEPIVYFEKQELLARIDRGDAEWNTGFLHSLLNI